MSTYFEIFKANCTGRNFSIRENKASTRKYMYRMENNRGNNRLKFSIETEMLQIYIIEISKAKRTLEKEPNNELAQWVLFLRCS